MSATEYYLNKGFTPDTRTTVINGTNTISVWTPPSGYRVIATQLSISANNAGTIAFFFDTTTDRKIAEFLVGASATIAPVIGAWESTVTSGRIFARVGTSGTDGWRVNLTGFEIPTSAI